jgi:hypothetical protein
MDWGRDWCVEIGLSDTFAFGGRPRFRGLESSTPGQMLAANRTSFFLKRVPSSARSALNGSLCRSGERLRLTPRGLD